jgi:hypothetical protein
VHTVIAITLIFAAGASGFGGERNLRAYLATRQRGPMVGAIVGYLMAAWFVFAALWLVWKG